MSDNSRNERKFILTDLSYDNLVALVHLHPAGFVKHHKSRLVNNIYFDTFNLSSYHDNVIGIGKRFKLRLRWYGPLQGEIEPLLQIKSKNGFSGTKQDYSIQKVMMTSDTPWKTIRNHIESSVTGEILSLFRFYYEPIIINCYQRSYFISSNQKFRLTIDRNIKYFNQSHGLAPNFENFTSFSEEIIMEIKYAVHLDNTAYPVTSWFPFRITKNSKYVSGINLVLEHI